MKKRLHTLQKRYEVDTELIGRMYQAERVRATYGDQSRSPGRKSEPSTLPDMARSSRAGRRRILPEIDLTKDHDPSEDLPETLTAYSPTSVADPSPPSLRPPPSRVPIARRTYFEPPASSPTEMPTPTRVATSPGDSVCEWGGPERGDDKDVHFLKDDRTSPPTRQETEIEEPIKESSCRGFSRKRKESYQAPTSNNQEERQAEGRTRHILKRKRQA